MNYLKRRHFLQAGGALLASLGFGQASFFRYANRVSSALAQPTKRKLALLVGINEYSSDLMNLRGCLTDVEMQSELLQYRYGFHLADILVLTDQSNQKPSRENIIAAFEEHLIEQAQPGDIVVFHFSGHGGLVIDPQPLKNQPLVGSLIPNDFTWAEPNGITGRTLFLLSNQLKTDNFTMMLDSCYSGGGFRGNQIVRALPTRSGSLAVQLSPLEEQYQERQLVNLGWSPEDFQEQRQRGIAKGVAIGAAQNNQRALDTRFNGFYAGALTYLLTQYFWQLPVEEPLSSSFNRLTLITREVSNHSQKPHMEVSLRGSRNQQPLYQLELDHFNAEAVVRESRDNNQVVFWMGGISSLTLEAFQAGSLFEMVDDDGEVFGEVEHINRIGLEGHGIVKSGRQPNPGTLLREKLRHLPSELSIKVGLDQSLLEKRVDIEKGLQDTVVSSQIQIVSIAQEAVVDFIIGTTASTLSCESQLTYADALPSEGIVGLFTSDSEIIPGSFGCSDESPQQSVERLRPILKMLLAKKVLNLTLNGGASQLKVDVSLLSRESGCIQYLNTTGSDQMVLPTEPTSHKVGSLVDVEVTNREENSIYLSVLAIGDDASITILHPVNWDSPEAASIVGSYATTPVSMEIFGPAGFFEILVVTSLFPLRNTLRNLQTIAAGRGLSRGMPFNFDGRTRSTIDSENTVIQFSHDLLDDMARNDTSNFNGSRSVRLLDSKKTGVFSTILQVVD